MGKVRITRDLAGYWSYLGTDILLIPPDQPTMCLQGFTERTAVRRIPPRRPPRVRP